MNGGNNKGGKSIAMEDLTLVHVKVFRKKEDHNNMAELARQLNEVGEKTGCLFFVTDETVEMTRIPKSLIRFIQNIPKRQ